MSEIQKYPNLVRGGEGNIFQKCPKFKNVPKVGGGGGLTLIGTLSQVFYFDASPNHVFWLINRKTILKSFLVPDYDFPILVWDESLE